MLRRFFIESGRRSPAAVACAAAVAGGAAAVIGAPSWCSDGGRGRRALSFGWGCQGQLGHGDDKHRLGPAVVDELEGDEVVQVAAAGHVSAFLLADGSVR
jgi:hypothetical protein